MKTNKILAILACATLALTSCQEEDLWGGNKYAPAKPGDEIIFGGTVQYKTTRVNATRTVYGDKSTSGTEIKWYEGDMVRIYCAEATLGEGDTEQKYCDYTVTNYIEKPVYENGTLTNPDESNPKGGGYTSTHSSGLVTADGNPGLRWGTGLHIFYGVYPTAGQLSAAGDNVAANALKLTSSTLEAYLPNTQEPTRYVAATTFAGKNYDGTANNNAKHYTIHPAMRNAYMVAKQTANPEDGGVILTFNPVVAAVEMTLINNSTHTEGNTTTGVALTDISLINLTANSPVCGYFKAGFDAKGNITCENVSTDQSYYTVGVPVEDENGNHVTLNYGDKITFTVFMTLPEDLNSISVSIVAGGVTKTATISGSNGVKIVQAQRKNFIANVPIALSTVKEVGLDAWVSEIPNKDADGNDNLVSYLSIPGAGGAASDGLTTNYDKQQTLSITELWNRGIRCFEFMVDKSSSLGDMPVVCGIQNVDMTLEEAVDEVAQNLKEHPQEFAVVIIGYQDVDVEAYDRQAGDNTRLTVGWGNEFHEWWNGYTFSGTATVNGTTITHAKAELTSATTVAAARGKLFCIVRPVCIGVDGGWYTGIPDGHPATITDWFGTGNLYDASKGPYVSALGWGNHPDHWYARGFGNLVTTGDATFTANQGGVADRPYEVYKNTKPTNTTDGTYTVPTKKSFAYKFINKADTPWSSISNYCWVQDWRRVVPDATIRTQYGIKDVTEADAQNGYNNGGSESWYYKWAPSVNEKWNDIVNTLDLSMGDASDNSYSYGLYINSLCGYFVDGDIPLSFQPRATFQRYSNTYYLDDKYNTTAYVGSANLEGSSTKPNRSTSWGPYHTIGGNEGNIAAYADWINNKFYNLLLTMLANGTLNGPTGIVMMDRVSDTADDPAGYYIPQIIISNNFSSSATSNVSITYSDTPFEASSDTPAAPARR